MTEVIAALDVNTLSEAEALLDRLQGSLSYYKIGMRLFTAYGREAVDLVRRKGGQVFLDLKLHDIPETVSQTIRQAQLLDVFSVSVHLWGGAEMLKAAVEVSPRPRLWGVTVLTSLTDESLRFLAPDARVQDFASRLARMGKDQRIDGIICSAREVSALRESLGPGTRFITPGIRPADSKADDQRRVVTPGEAARLGIDYVVIGRPITHAADPLQAVKNILAEISSAGATPAQQEKLKR